MDAKGPALTGDGGELTFDLTEQLFLLLVQTGLVQHFGNFVTCENKAAQAKHRIDARVIGVQVGALHVME